MARKSVQEKREEKKAVREIRAEQDQEVIDMYANIASIRNCMRDLSPAVQQSEDTLNLWFDATYPSSGKKATAKGRHHTYQAIKKLRAKFAATQFDMDQFEQVLNDEWAVEQKKSWEQRDAFLGSKVTELNKYCKQFKTELKEYLTEAEINVPGFDDDEVWNETEAAALEEGEDDEAEPVADADDEGEERKAKVSARGTENTKLG